ncbi:hypothetical protein C0J52_03222 [Blattella germanica]|nr:hypothetical protein C0J52_03222 [Blattella germanica]
MESLVGYGSDDESGENYQDNRKSDIGRGMDRMRQGEEDVNYDNVQMDMSEESNNNHSGSSNEDDKSSTKSSSSRSSRSSERSLDSVGAADHEKAEDNFSRVGKNGNGLSSADLGKRKDEEIKFKEAERHKNRYSKEKSDREKKEKLEHQNNRDRDRGIREFREKEHQKSRDRDRVRRDERRSKSHSRERDRERKRSRSRDRANKRRSPSPDRHGSSRHRDEKSRYRRERRSPGNSRPRSRSRDRDRGKSSSSSSSSSRRGSYEKKPSKLTILERLGIELRPPEAAPAVTPQQLLQKSIEQQVQQVKSNTGIELPKYYNPAAMNPARYAEQMQKRKLLWGSKSQPQESKDEAKPAVPVSNNKWEGTTFAQDQDGKMTAKFKRLMGIKDSGGGTSTASSSSGPPSNNPEGNEILKKQEELFNSMEMQYEVARVATHTHRETLKHSDNVKKLLNVDIEMESEVSHV